MQKKKISLAKLITPALLVLLFSISIFYSCGANLFSLNDDVKFGEDLDKQIKSSPREYPMLEGHQELSSYVSNLGSYLITTSPSIKYKDVFPYKFQIIDDTIINAFCTPGGYIYVYTGLMRYIDNEATLAGIMAHEVAHAECRHTTQRLTSYYGISMVMNIVLGSNPSTLADIMANLFVGVGFLANSRSDEQEADTYSIKYLTTTKYFPGAIKYFFDKISAEQAAKGNNPGALDRLLSTHPLPQDRIDNVAEQLKINGISQDTTRNLFRNEYQNLKTKLPPKR